MKDDIQSIRIFTMKSEMDKAFHTLEGIMKGINIDREINEKEISDLKLWCRINYGLINHAPFSEVIPFIVQITDDNKVTNEEYEDLKWLCNNITTKNKYYDVITSDIQRLEGILHGILSDNKISREEIIGLKEWIEEHEDLIGSYPYDEIETLVLKVLEDNVVSDEEQSVLKLFFSQFIDIETTCIDINELESLKNEIKLPTICTMNPKITIKNSLFCFTGISSRGKRENVVGIIEQNHGYYNDNMTNDTNYLIIGDKNNPCWVFSCYGRKVEKAIENRKNGNDIQIVKEIDFWDAIS
jgi:hypothetical protein